MSFNAQEAFCLDSFQDHLLFWDDFEGDQIKDEWDSVGAGSAAVVDAQTGGIMRITTGAISGNIHQVDWQDYRSLLVSKKVTIEFHAKLVQNTSQEVSLKLWADNNNQIDFFTVDGGDWSIRCENGGISTTVTTGVGSDTAYHIFRIECFPTDEVHFYIDRVETANSPITTNITPDYLQPTLFVKTREDATKSMDVDYCYVRQER